MGFEVILPSGAAKMRSENNFEASSIKSWYDDPADFYLKADLMREHFVSIQKSDLVLVINDKKHGMDGYVGPNVVMEMGVAFYLNKPIYVLNEVSKEMPTYEEVLGVMPILLDGTLNKLNNFKKEEQ